MKHLEHAEAVLEAKWPRVLSGSVLKLLALFTMIVDHVGVFLLKDMEFATEPLLTLGSKTLTLYWICRKIGRLAFPLYCFLLCEGYQHTRDKKRYGITLLAFALVSEIPWNLVHSGHLLYAKQNVFFTLFLGYLALCCYEYFRKMPAMMLLGLSALLLAAKLFRTDYGFHGIAFILFLYLLREHRTVQAVIGSVLLDGVSSVWAVFLAFIPINMYNGERGFIKGKVLKYAFYIAYPLHLLLLYLIKLKLST